MMTAQSPWSGNVSDTSKALAIGFHFGGEFERTLGRTISASNDSRAPGSGAYTAFGSPKPEEVIVTDFSAKDYVDAKIGEVKAVQRADFSEVMSKIEVLRGDMKSVSDTSIKRSDLYIGLAGAVGVIVAVVIGIATVGADRFSAGMSVQPVIQKTVQDQTDAFKAILDAQAGRDVAQDEQLKDISVKLDAILKGVSIGQTSPNVDQ